MKNTNRNNGDSNLFLIYDKKKNTLNVAKYDIAQYIGFKTVNLQSLKIIYKMYTKYVSYKTVLTLGSTLLNFFK